ncbi:hypothetical protein EDEG_02865 [Edhazardia aedis USNM 41457]|uniref:Uncharacterized protein n=1 Tax=Edhazardia aedis (strain USNM 41457) TaxID=1003232 RepID=J9D5D4_EDHAE|nr:hypothetical protein EDEG_02865 [Edhazardia aedis USNM 41457]|eukprot:EJW02744.1 hypothetical protein EDEG_02865 [Edhazardia aedis USNM 41457]
MALYNMIDDSLNLLALKHYEKDTNFVMNGVIPCFSDVDRTDLLYKRDPFFKVHNNQILLKVNNYQFGIFKLKYGTDTIFYSFLEDLNLINVVAFDILFDSTKKSTENKEKNLEPQYLVADFEIEDKIKNQCDDYLQEKNKTQTQWTISTETARHR